MIDLLTRCIACHGSLDFDQDRNSFPLCTPCQRSLTFCPPLCPSCGSPICLQSPAPGERTAPCQRPWVRRKAISSYSSRYLLSSPCYFVLKKWKIRRGPLFDRQVLRIDENLLTTWRHFQADAVVPVPQQYQRAWEMGGSRSETIALWVAKCLSIPFVQGLAVPTYPSWSSLSAHPQNVRQHRQAQLRMQDRLQSQIRFYTHKHDIGKIRRVILVDDFMTSGRTIEKASDALYGAGIQNVHAFSLGLKVHLLKADRSPHLLESCADTKTIG